jgi:hypothetical protein
VLDGRVYRTAFLPALLALCVGAFALQDRPAPGRSALPPDTFQADRAFKELGDMDKVFPDRTPGSTDDRGLAELVQRELAAPEEQGNRPAFTVERTTTESGLETVIATKPGLSTRSVVVLADRDANGAAELSATAALIELGRVFKGRDLRKTLVLVSTTGASNGFEGAREWAHANRDAPIDAVLVLGDMAGMSIKKPWVISWPLSSGAPPLGVERTVQAAVRREASGDPGGPRALGQWVRRAIPVTVSAQGPIGAEGLPAVMISESGELGPKPDEPVDEKRLGAFGRSAVRAVGGLDAVGPRDAPAFAGAPSGIVTLRNVLSDWSVRLIVGALLLPALLAALDAFFRARRRRVPIAPWLTWLAVAAVPLPVAWLWLRMIGAIGAIGAPAGPVTPQPAIETSGIVALTSAAIAGALACFGARLAARALGSRTTEPEEPPRNGRGRPAPGVEGLAVATMVWLVLLATVAWLCNPYAAGLLIGAVHLWLFAASGRRRWPALAALLAGLVMPALALAHLGLALDLGPHELVWGWALAAMTGGAAGTTLLLAGLMAALAGVVRVIVARGRLARAGGEEGDHFRTRGPLTYAGPGSLGGTESALRR